MYSMHSSRRGLQRHAVTRAREHDPTFVSVSPSLHRAREPPSRYTQLPFSLPSAETTVTPLSSAACALSHPTTHPALKLPRNTGTASSSHNVCFDFQYHEPDPTSSEDMDGPSPRQAMGLDMAVDINMPLDPALDIAFENGVVQNQSSPIQDSTSLDPDFNALSTSTAPLSLPMTAMASATVAPTAFDNADQVQQPLHCRGSTSPSMYSFNEPGVHHLDETFVYGDPKDFGMGQPSTSADGYDTYMSPPVTMTLSCCQGHNLLPLPQESEPTVILAGENSAYASRSHENLSRRYHSVAVPSVEDGGTAGADYSRANSSTSSLSRGRRCSGSSNNSLESVSNRGPCSLPVTQPFNINGTPPADPADWRARLRYCEQATHKASLDASLVRLLEFPEGLDGRELAARRAANLRFDRVREQRLKDRNNEAAKRSRQRKVRRIEDAEQQIEALKLDRAYLVERVAHLEKLLAAATGMATDTAPIETAPALPVQSQSLHEVSKPPKLRNGPFQSGRSTRSGRCSKPQTRRSSLGLGLGRGGHGGPATRSRANGHTRFQEDGVEDGDEDVIQSNNDSDGSGHSRDLV